MNAPSLTFLFHPTAIIFSSPFMCVCVCVSVYIYIYIYIYSGGGLKL